MTSFVVTPVMRNFVVTAIVLIVVTAPTTTQHNLNTEVGLDMKMTLHTPHTPLITTETQQ